MIISDDSVECLFLQAMILVSELRPHDLESVKTLVLEVKSEPYRREVAPTHLLQDDVSIVEDLPTQSDKVFDKKLTQYAQDGSHLHDIPLSPLAFHQPSPHRPHLRASPSSSWPSSNSFAFHPWTYRNSHGNMKYFSSLALAPMEFRLEKVTSAGLSNGSVLWFRLFCDFPFLPPTKPSDFASSSATLSEGTILC